MATIISISTLLLVIVFLLFKIYNLNKENIVKEIKEKSFIFDKPVNSNPRYSDSDPNLEILKDTLYSMCSEKWKTEIKFESSYGLGEMYELTFLNALGTIKLCCKIRIYETLPNIYLSWFNIKKMNNSVSHSHIITFDEDNKKEKWIILGYMWQYILDYHKDMRDERMKYHLDCKDVISKELKSLNRDRKLDDILGF